MSIDYIENGKRWYSENKNHVDELLKKDRSNFSFRPSLEDLYRPQKWKPGHWLWFFEEVKK